MISCAWPTRNPLLHCYLCYTAPGLLQHYVNRVVWRFGSLYCCQHQPLKLYYNKSSSATVMNITSLILESRRISHKLLEVARTLTSTDLVFPLVRLHEEIFSSSTLSITLCVIRVKCLLNNRDFLFTGFLSRTTRIVLRTCFLTPFILRESGGNVWWGVSRESKKFTSPEVSCD